MEYKAFGYLGGMRSLRWSIDATSSESTSFGGKVKVLQTRVSLLSVDSV